MTKLSIFCVILFGAFTLHTLKAQSQVTTPEEQQCLSGIIFQQMLEEDSAFKNKCLATQKTLDSLKKLRKEKGNLPTDIDIAFRTANDREAEEENIRTIPVVVHIIAPQSFQNLLTDSDVERQIDTLTANFRGLNADTANIPDYFKPLLGKSSIVFKLAKRDPDGFHNTNGIVRTISNATLDRSRTRIPSTRKQEIISKTGYNWNTNEYINIKVIPFSRTAGSSSVLGFAFLPDTDTSISAVYINFPYFGVQQSYNATSNFNLGKTLVHEMGHYLSLFHIWGDDASRGSEDVCSGSDLIDDTPNQKGPTQNRCPTFPVLFFNSNGPCNPNPFVVLSSMFMNFMDYSNDECLLMFTIEQQQRMLDILTFHRNRNTLFASEKHIEIAVDERTTNLSVVIDTPNYFTFCDTTSLDITVTNSGNNPIRWFTLRVLASDNTLLFDTIIRKIVRPRGNVHIKLADKIVIPTGDYVKIEIPSEDHYVDPDFSNNFFVSYVQQYLRDNIPYRNSPEPIGNIFVNSNSSVIYWRDITSSSPIDGTTHLLELNGAENATAQAQIETAVFTPHFIDEGNDSIYLKFNLGANISSTSDIDFRILLQEQCSADINTIFSLSETEYYSNLPSTIEPSANIRPETADFTTFEVNLSDYRLPSSVPFRVLFSINGVITDNLFINNIEIYKKIDRYFENNELLVNYNATTHQIFIFHSSPPSNLNSVNIYNLSGQLVYSRNLSSADLTDRIMLDIPGAFPSGIYLVNLNYDTKRITKRIIVNR